MAEIKKYTIELTYVGFFPTFERGNKEIITIRTNNIKWSMTQYQRNRDPFNWRIIKEEEL